MAKFRIKPGSVRRIEADLRNKKQKMQRKIAFALALWADDTVGAMKAEVMRVKAFDTGMLHASIQRSAPQLIGTKLRIVMFTPAEYASVVEFGRKARSGRPPLKALIGWAKRKGITKAVPVNANIESGKYAKKLAAARMIRRNMKKGRKKSGRSKPIADRELLDFLILLSIQYAIGRRGVKGRKPITRVFDQRAKTLRRDIIKSVRTFS